MREVVVDLTPDDRWKGLELRDDHVEMTLGLDGEDVRVATADGRLIGILRHRAVSESVAFAAWQRLREIREQPKLRGIAVVGEGAQKTPVVTSDGYRSNFAYIDHRDPRVRGISSAIIGFFERTARYPFCRVCRWNLENPDKWADVVPYAQAASRVFKLDAPMRYSFQEAAAQQVCEDFRIPGTVFTTITVNRNWQTRVHRDAGDLDEGFGVIGALTAGTFEGGLYVLAETRPRIGFALRHRSILLTDVHLWHGNSPIHGLPGRYERVTTVFYMRKRMVHCGDHSHELRRARDRKAGQPLFDTDGAPLSTDDPEER